MSFSTGDRVNITGGAFAGMTGTVTDYPGVLALSPGVVDLHDDERYVGRWVVVSIFGRLVPVDVSVDHLEYAS